MRYVIKASYITLFIVTFILAFVSSTYAENISPQDNQVTENDWKPDRIEDYEGVHLEINLANNKLSVFLNNIEMYSFRIASGKHNNKTPLGSYKIVTKVVNPWYLPKNIAGGDPKNPLGTRWLGLNVGETSGYKYGIHGTNNPYSIGSYVTQGCIRLNNHEVEWLYRHLTLGTPVYIYNSSLKPKE